MPTMQMAQPADRERKQPFGASVAWQVLHGSADTLCRGHAWTRQGRGALTPYLYAQTAGLSALQDEREAEGDRTKRQGDQRRNQW